MSKIKSLERTQKERIILKDFKQFGGKHCQTAALKNILDYKGLHFSEEMLLGLGGGIGFVYWHMKQMPSPFIGTRYGKVVEFLENICDRIGIEATISQTTSPKKGYEELKEILRKGEPAYIFVDMVYLPYFALPEIAHFGGHTVVVFGVDEEENKVYISDRCKKAVTVSIEDLKKARSSRHSPMPPKNKLLRIKWPLRAVDLKEGIREAIRDCCRNMLNPPIRNIGLLGIKKWADIVLKWPKQFKDMNLIGCLLNTFIYIEIGGTGGSGFRTMYAQFLREASSILNESALEDVAEMFEKSGKLWSEIAIASLPDSYPILKRLRESMIEKNKIFLEQEVGALEKMKQINEEMNSIMNIAIEELRKDDLTPLLTSLRNKILECWDIEKKTFEMLNGIIK